MRAGTFSFSKHPTASHPVATAQLRRLPSRLRQNFAVKAATPLHCYLPRIAFQTRRPHKTAAIPQPLLQTAPQKISPQGCHTVNITPVLSKAATSRVRRVSWFCTAPHCETLNVHGDIARVRGAQLVKVIGCGC